MFGDGHPFSRSKQPPGECQDAIPCSAEVAGALCDLVMEDGHL